MFFEAAQVITIGSLRLLIDPLSLQIAHSLSSVCFALGVASLEAIVNSHRAICFP